MRWLRAACLVAVVALALAVSSTSTAGLVVSDVGSSEFESDATPAAFIEHSTWMASETEAGADPALATQFLTHHVKAKRSFAAGFRPPHLRTRLAGMKPAATCECQLSSSAPGADALFIEKAGCRLPRRYWVSSGNQYSRPFTPATERHVSRLLGEISSLRLVKVSGASFSCVDGRKPHGGPNSLQTESRSLHSFGGDFGEFVLMLGVLHQHMGARLYESTVEQMFRTFIDTPTSSRKAKPYFYYHTDIESLSRIAGELGYEVMHRNSTWVNPIKGGEKIAALKPGGESSKAEDTQLPFIDFTNPPLHLQKLLLESLVRPENQGCAHLRLLMSFPALYGIPLEVVQWTLRSYFRILWNKDELGSMTDGAPLYFKLKFVISHGEHNERAWINVRNTRPCDHAGIAGIITTQASDEKPWSKADAKAAVFDRDTTDAAESSAVAAAPPAATGPSGAGPHQPDDVFMFHPQAVQHRREELADLIVGKRATITFTEALADLNALADNVESRTQQLLAKNIPEYNVRIV